MKANRRFGLGVVFIAALMLPAAALAAAEGEPPGYEEFIFQVINLVIMLAVIVYFARKPVAAYLAQRREQIQSDVETATELLSEAEARHREIQDDLSNLASEVENLQEVSRRRAQEEAERILAEAQRSAERIQSDATAAIDQELLRAQRELRSEAAALAIDMASEILSQQVSDADRERLLDEFIDRVESGTDTQTQEPNG